VRITIGNKSWRINTDRGSAEYKSRASEIGKEINESIMRMVGNVAIEFSPGIIRNLRARIDTQTRLEAVKIFERAVSIIDERRVNQKVGRGGAGPRQVIGITSDMLFPNLSPDAGPLLSGLNDVVMWDRLSPKWAKYKSRKYPKNAQKFFQASGNLRAQLNYRGRDWVNSRLGGVQLESKLAQPKRDNLQTGDLEMVLGQIHVRIFPKVSSLLLPGLATRRWATVDRSGDFDRSVIRHATGEKLAGSIPGRQRPLLQPIVQFFILYRIPGAIRKAVTRWATYNLEGVR